MNSENRKTCKPHRLLLNFANKINLKRSDKYVALSNLTMYYTCKNKEKSYKNNKFKISATTWNEEFSGSYSVSDIQDCFKYITKLHEAVSDNPPMRIYVKKRENSITLGINTGYYLQL